MTRREISGFPEGRISNWRQALGEQRRFRRGKAWFREGPEVMVVGTQDGIVTSVRDVSGRRVKSMLYIEPQALPQGSFEFMIALDEGEENAVFSITHPLDIEDFKTENNLEDPTELTGAPIRLHMSGSSGIAGIEILESPLRRLIADELGDQSADLF